MRSSHFHFLGGNTPFRFSEIELGPFSLAKFAGPYKDQRCQSQSIPRHRASLKITNGCGYCIASHTASARKAGMTDAMFGELMAVVGMANETNRLANGYRVPIDEAFER